MYRNKVMLCGRLTKDIEIRKTSTGKSVTTFSLAVDDGKDANGQNKAVFITCTAWEQTANLLSQYCRKGSLIGIEGHLQQRRWEEKQVTLTEVFVEGIQFLESRRESTQEQTQAPAEPSGYSLNITSDDLPF